MFSRVCLVLSLYRLDGLERTVFASPLDLQESRAAHIRVRANLKTRQRTSDAKPGMLAGVAARLDTFYTEIIKFVVIFFIYCFQSMFILNLENNVYK